MDVPLLGENDMNIKRLSADEIDRDMVWCDADQITNDIEFLRRRLYPVRNTYSEFVKLRHAWHVMATMGLPMRPEITARLRQMTREINLKLAEEKGSI